jgi:hypothetical protein
LEVLPLQIFLLNINKKNINELLKEQFLPLVCKKVLKKGKSLRLEKCIHLFNALIIKI